MSAKCRIFVKFPKGERERGRGFEGEGGLFFNLWWIVAGVGSLGLLTYPLALMYVAL